MGVLTIEKGSRFDCPPKRKLGEVTVIGGDVVLRGGRRFVVIWNSVVRAQIEKDPGAMYPMSLRFIYTMSEIVQANRNIGMEKMLQMEYARLRKRFATCSFKL